MGKKRKVDDKKPLEIPSEKLEQAKYYEEILLEFCAENDITCIIAMSAYDRLTGKEPFKFSGSGPRSSKLGLHQCLGDFLVDGFIDFDGELAFDEEDGDGDVGSKH
jgi:hypothetical protein